MNLEHPTVFHISHCRAGSLWLSNILSELEPNRIIHGQAGNAKFLNAALVSGSIYTPLYLTKEIFHTVKLPKAHVKFFIMRDIRDTLASGYLSLRYGDFSNDVGLLHLKNILTKMTVDNGLLMLMDEWLPAQAEIQRSWLQSDVKVIRYEDLLDDHYRILADLLIGHCGLEIAPDRLKHVVACSPLESLIEGRDFAEWESSSEEGKYVTGGWINYFTPVVFDKFAALYADLLLSSSEGASDSMSSSVIRKIGGWAKLHTLDGAEILEGYDAACALYPFVPPLSHWRAWECAAYRKFVINGRVLDLGCGDGRYFRLIWPEVHHVVGVDREAGVMEAALRSGVYCQVHNVNAHQVPEQDESFDHVFANCSLEHMDNLDDVLAEVHRCLKPGGSLICSVVTNRFLQWNPLPKLIGMAGFMDAEASLQKDFFEFHHLVNPLSTDEWQQRFRNAGLLPEVHIPILPKFNTGIFLFMDSLWHVKRSAGGELGDFIYPFLMENPKFPEAFRLIISGLLHMETDFQDCSGAVFLVRKPLRDSE